MTRLLFTGLDVAVQTTAAATLVARLEAMGHEVIILQEGDIAGDLLPANDQHIAWDKLVAEVELRVLRGTSEIEDIVGLLHKRQDREFPRLTNPNVSGHRHPNRGKRRRQWR